MGDTPSEQDKPGGWIDPAQEPQDVTSETPTTLTPVPTETTPEATDTTSDTSSTGDDTGEMDVPGFLSVDEVAWEVVGGSWGTGQQRRLALSKAGYKVKDVEAAVKKILNSR